MSDTAFENFSTYNLKDILTKNDLNKIIEKKFDNKNVVIKKIVLKQASKEMLGFLGDHLRLKVTFFNSDAELHLFIKCVPKHNIPKRDLILEENFFDREEIMFKIFEEVGGDQGWHPEAYIYNKNVVVMPDLDIEGYKMLDKFNTFDLDHCLLAVTSMVKLHQTSMFYELSKKQKDPKYKIMDEFGETIREYNMKEGSWLTAGVKAIHDFISNFFKLPDLSELSLEFLTKKAVEACENIREHDNELNVIIHKDVWYSNLLFKYENNRPIDAILLDFQCIRYAPPAFDLMLLIYLNTSRKFRKVHLDNILQHYWKHLEDALKTKLNIKYESVFKFIHEARTTALFLTLLMFQFILMDDETRRKSFDDPKTYDYAMNVDRSKPFIDFCYQSEAARARYFELCDELITEILIC